MSIAALILRAMSVKSRHLVVRLHLTAVREAVMMDTFPKVIGIMTGGNVSAIGKMNVSNSFFKFKNGSEIWFAGIDNKERMEKILGKEYSSIYINESSEVSYAAFDILKTRLAEKNDLRKRFLIDCNPRGKSHWTYKTFIEGIKADGSGAKIPMFDDYGCIQLNPQDNADNIDENYLDMLQGLSEKDKMRFLAGEFADETEGALWTFDDIVIAKNLNMNNPCRRVLALDPSVSDGHGDEVGIIVASCDNGKPGDRRALIEHDLSAQLSTEEWVKLAVRTYYQLDCDAIVCETNQGGDLIETSLNAFGFQGKLIKVHAKKGKYSRAEPVSVVYKQPNPRVAHAKEFKEMCEEMQNYVPLVSSKSPNRLDALVYALTDLLELKETKALMDVFV